MTINSSFNSVNVRPEKPVEPTPPAGGNIENRQPPSEPLPPIQINVGEISDNSTDLNQNDTDNIVDIYI